jgi:signal transduction histidine kinase
MSDTTTIVDNDHHAVERAEQLFREQRDANYRRTSRLFAVLLGVQWIAGVIVALTLSPYAWEGRVATVHTHVWAAIFLGGLITSLPLYLALRAPDAPATRYLVAVGQMMWSALLIHLTGGRIETHFHVFGSLAFLAFYRDWKVLIPATIVVATDHLARQMFWPESVYGITDPAWWRFLEHAFWVVFEDTILITACIVASMEMRDVARSRAAVEILSEREIAKSAELRRALTELENAQDAQVRAEKLAAVGQLAASVGHELRNPLAAVRNANAFIAKKVKANGADPKVIQFAELVEKELDVCSKIIGDLLDFARERPLVLAPVPMRDLVEEAISLVPGGKAEIVNRVPGDLPVPLLDKEQFRQVLINLVQNAAEAMEPRGHGKVIVDAEKQGGVFRLTIQDDGPGMPQETVDKVFEPLFTTKVKGTGLGLAIVAGIVKRHQGTIAVTSKVGRGTTFTIEWAAQAAASRTEPRPKSVPPRNATASVTIAERSK